MKHLVSKSDEQLYKSSLLDFYFDNMKIGTMDIETTGLNPSKNKFILGGLYDFSTGNLHQFFAESRGEEPAALSAFIEQMSQLDMIVTYNGRHFDVPFVEKRRSAFRSGLAFAEHADPGAAASAEGRRLRNLSEVPLPYNLDLYLILNGHSPVKKFVPNLKQKTVENYMGLWQNRTDEISGAESIDLYNTYENTRDPELERQILLHNSDDVLQLARLIKIISKSDFHKAMYCLGFPSGPLTVDKITINRNTLTVSGSQRICAIDYMGFSFGDFPVETNFSKKEKAFVFKFPLISDSGFLIVDLDAAGLAREDFEKYPTCESGFLILSGPDGINYMETNHFVKNFLTMFMKDI